MSGSKIQELLKSAGDGLVAILKEGEMGMGGYAGNAGGGVGGHPGGAPAQPPPPAAAPAPEAPKPPTNGGVSPKGVMMDVHQRLAAAMDQLDEQGGTNGEQGPELVNEVKTLAGLLMAISQDPAAQEALGGNPAEPPKPPAPAPPPGVPGAPPNPSTVVPGGPMDPKQARLVLKAELDNYTAMMATINAARDRLWRTTDTLLPKDPAAAAAEFREIAGMLDKAAELAKTAENTEKLMKTLKMDPTAFTAFAAEQLKKAGTEKPEAATKRLEMLQKVTAVAKSSWEGTDKPPSEISVEIEEAYVGTGDGLGVGSASAQDLTTKKDQEDKTVKLTSLDSGSPGVNSAAENPASDAKTNAATGSNNGGTNLPSSNASADNNFAENLGKTGAQNLSKLIGDLEGVAKIAQHQATVKKRHEANPWLPDINTPAFLEESDPAKVQKRAAESLDFGRDPWAE